MRIITGKAKGKKLVTLNGEATRPTSERVKEAIFSMIQFEIEGRSVLDLFGGSGQLGLEALSRGAKKAVIADSSREAMSIIAKNADITKLSDNCHLLNCDWTETIKRLSGEKFDIVFLDPPYKLDLIPLVIEPLYEIVKPTSIIVCESGNSLSDKIGEKYEIIKQAKYGIAYITIIKPQKEI